MKQKFCFLFLSITLLVFPPMRVARSFVEAVSVEPILKLKNQTRSDLDFLARFQKSRGKELSVETTSGISDLETHYQQLSDETDKTIGQLAPDKVAEEKIVNPLK